MDNTANRKPFDWNEIYKVDEKNYTEQLKQNQEYYKGVDKSEYATIYKCVDHAIREGNHAAFVHFFLKEERSRSRVFGRKLSTLLEKQKKKKGFSKIICWNQAPLIQQNYWRAFDFEFTQESIRQKTAEKKKKTIAYGVDLDPGKESPQRGNWRRGKAIPPRDVIVQMAICLALSLEDTNRLLQSAGMSALYVLDIIDVCSMFTIRKYADDFSISPFEKLAETKSQINQAQKRYLNDQMTIVPFADGKNAHLFAGSGPLGWEIDRIITEIKKALEEGMDVGPATDVSITKFLTKLYEERFRTADSIYSYIRTDQSDAVSSNETDTEISVFLQRYYGFLRKTLMFLDKSEQYGKNLRYSGWKLIAQDERPAKPLQQHPKERQSDSLTDDRKKALRKIEKIWHTADLVDENGNEFTADAEWVDTDLPTGGFTIPRQMIEGRIIGAKKNSDGKSPFAYEMNFGNKVHLMKYAIATGNEDQVGSYLQLAGVWSEDWYEYYKNDDTRHGASKEETDHLDRSDCLLLYALRYRDELIRHWNEKEDPLYASQVHRAFPMIKLFLTINRDITLACMKLSDENGKGYDHPTRYCTTEDYEGQLIKLQDEMIYPIAWYYIKKKVNNKALNLNSEERCCTSYSTGLWRWQNTELGKIR